MPARKEPKEAVVYSTAPKRPAPAFKPHRPFKVPHIPTIESESSVRGQPVRKLSKPVARTASRRRNEDVEKSSDDDDSEEELADNPLAARPPKPNTSAAPPACKVIRQPSPMSISDEDRIDTRSTKRATVPEPSQTASGPAIPQPLLVRLLHENFSDKTTKIDKHAIQVLQKYLEVFIRETIARATLRKKEDVNVSELDANWLEAEDLEKIAAQMVLDF